MKYYFFTILFVFQTNFLCCQSSLEDYTYFTSERRQVLHEMGKFFDQTIRENFPAETDTLSYKYFSNTLARYTGVNGIYILNVDRSRLREINRMLFKDHNYYFFYVRYLHVDKGASGHSTHLGMDSVPTVRDNRPAHEKSIGFWWLFGDILNKGGYIGVVPEDNPAIRDMRSDLELTIDLSITVFLPNVLGVNLREVSKPEVKELCAVVFWRYLCASGGINLVERQNFCDHCAFEP